MPEVRQTLAAASDRPRPLFERLLHAAGDSTVDDQTLFERLIHADGDSTVADQTLGFLASGHPPSRRRTP
jgi:hypothetical protein